VLIIYKGNLIDNFKSYFCFVKSRLFIQEVVMKKLILLISFFLFVFIACNKNEEINYKELQLTDLQGNTVSLEKYRNKTVFVNYWATWCRPCIKEMPRIDLQRKILEREGYAFVFISDEKLETLNNFEKKNNFDFNFLHSTTKLKELGINTFPTTVILNKNLEKIGSIKGEQRWESAGHLKLLRQYANAKSK